MENGPQRDKLISGKNFKGMERKKRGKEERQPPRPPLNTGHLGFHLTKELRLHVLSVHHMCARDPQKPEEGVASPGMELQTCVSYRVHAEHPLKEQPMEIHRTQTQTMDGDRLLPFPGLTAVCHFLVADPRE